MSSYHKHLVVIMPASHHDVGRFEIQVDDPVIVDVVQSLYDLCHEQPALLLCQGVVAGGDF